MLLSFLQLELLPYTNLNSSSVKVQECGCELFLEKQENSMGF